MAANQNKLEDSARLQASRKQERATLLRPEPKSLAKKRMHTDSTLVVVGHNPAIVPRRRKIGARNAGFMDSGAERSCPSIHTRMHTHLVYNLVRGDITEAISGRMAQVVWSMDPNRLASE